MISSAITLLSVKTRLKRRSRTPLLPWNDREEVGRVRHEINARARDDGDHTRGRHRDRKNRRSTSDVTR